MKQLPMSRPTFEQRLSQQAKEMEEQAYKTGYGPERDALLRKARQCDVAANIDAWLKSPGLRSPR